MTLQHPVVDFNGTLVSGVGEVLRPLSQQRVLHVCLPGAEQVTGFPAISAG